MGKSTAKFSALVALGSGLVTLPVAALELGEATVRSSLGQPLRASIAFALGPNEALSSTCVSMQRSLPKSNDMPVIGPATIRIGDGIIAIAGKSEIREPLVSMRINVNCPYTAKLSREYILFVNPASMQTQPLERVQSTPVTDGESISLATRYRVRPGDSLSRIVERIENRPVGHWPAIVAVFDANPAAFINNDPNMIIPGSWLTIPDFSVTEPTAVFSPATQTTSAVPQTAATTAPVAPRRRQLSGEFIGLGTRYRVREGDSVSGIAERIQNRPGAHWPAVMAIFNANPEAFIDNDPNLLVEGSWLDIPDFGVEVPLTVANRNVLPREGQGTAYPGISAGEIVEQPSTEPVVSEPVVSEPVLSEPVAKDPVIDEPDVSEPVYNDNSYATTSAPDGDSEITIPDTRLEGPVVTATSPNVPTATIQATPDDSSSSSWLAWLGGAGLALIVALLYLGQRARGRFASSPIGVVVTPPKRRRSDDDTTEIEAISEADVSGMYESPVEVSFEDMDDESIDESIDEASDNNETEENLILDADLVIGTGLQTGRDVDVAQDFGFAATTALDMELPEEMSSGTREALDTQMIPPMNVELESILEAEVLADEDEDDYDMSVIVDATKMPNTDDATQRDLEAIPVETNDDTLIKEGYTVKHEVDYKILEQDYEDEFTATQALNHEIERAAAALTEHMHAKKAKGGDDTKAMPLASVTPLDALAKVSADGDDEISDLDDTGVNEELTINMDDADGTVDIMGDDETTEMPITKDKAS